MPAPARHEADGPRAPHSRMDRRRTCPDLSFRFQPVPSATQEAWPQERTTIVAGADASAWPDWTDRPFEAALAALDLAEMTGGDRP